MKLVQERVEVEPMSIKAKLLRELVSHLKGGMADELKAKYHDEMAEPKEGMASDPDKMLEGSEEMGSLSAEPMLKGASKLGSLNPDEKYGETPEEMKDMTMTGDKGPLDEEALREFIKGMDQDALSKMLGGK